MPRTALFSILFIIAGLFLFVLFAPLFFRGHTEAAGRIGAPFIVITFGCVGIAVGRRAKQMGWILWNARTILRTVLYSVFFIFMGLLLFAMLVPMFFRGNTEAALRIAVPFIVIIFACLGISVGRSENRRRTVGNANLPGNESQASRPADGPGVGEEREKNERTYDY